MNGSRDRTVAATRAAVAIGKGSIRVRELTRVVVGGPVTWGGAKTSGEAGASRMCGDGLPDELQQPLAEDLSVECARVLAKLVRVPADHLCASDRADQAFDILSLEQHASGPVDDRI